MVNRRVRNAVLGCNLKNDRMISVHFQDKPFNITVTQVYAPTNNAEEAERFYEDLQDLLELTPPKRWLFHYRGLEYKSRKSRNTWSNRQVRPWGTKWSRSKANRVLPRECIGQSKHLFQQHKRRLYTWTSPDGQHRNRLIIFFAAKIGEALYSQKKQDQELTVAQMMNFLLPNSDLN